MSKKLNGLHPTKEKEILDQVNLRLGEGWQLNWIADELNVHRNTLYRFILKNGLV